MLKRLNALTIEGTDRIYNIIMKGPFEETNKKIQHLEPIIVETHKLSLDEIYRYEVKGENHEPIA